MKVAVFGDSYADEVINKGSTDYKSWVEILREKYYPELTCYGVSGSSVYFSYDLFIKHHRQFDKIIFVASTYNRIMIPHYIKFSEVDDADLRRHINGIDVAENNLKNLQYMTEESILATKAAIEYYKYLHDNRRDKRYCKLMKESVKKIRNDAVMIDTVSPGLSDIAFYELGGKPDNLGSYRDVRRCHLSKRNNEILADKMFEWSNGAPVQINVTDFEIPSKEELSRLVYML